MLLSALSFRVYLLIANDFPINDGALFLEFVEPSAGTFPALPTVATYNGLLLPFAYPPLAFWVGALLTKFGVSSLDVVRAMPIVMNMIYVLLFTLLLLKSGRSPLFTALALLLFSVTLRSFEWLMMGGGLTRGLGSIFFMLTLLAVSAPGGRGGALIGRWRMALAGATVAGAILSHLEWGILAAASVVLSRALASPSIKGFIISCLVSGLTAITLVVPWLLWVHSAHGLEPFLSAGGTSGWDPKTIGGGLWGFAVQTALGNPVALIGGGVLIARRQWFWITFILLCLVLTPRHAPTPAVLGIAILSAQGIISTHHFAGKFIRSQKLLIVCGVLLVAALTGFRTYRTVLYAPTSFRALPAETRQAMNWVANRHPGARFAIVNERPWQIDSTEEWFPKLASAQSVTTVQGREWNGQFRRSDKLNRALWASRNCPELHSNLRQFGRFDFVWAEKMNECFGAPHHQLVYRKGGVNIYRVNSPVQAQ